MKQYITDELLTAYLDAELSEEEIELVNNALSHDASIRSRLDILEVDKTTLKSSLDVISPIAPQMPELEQKTAAQRSARGFSSMAFAASVVLGFILGAWLFDDILSRSQNTSSSPEWKMAIANYQILYVPETLANTVSTQEQAINRLKSLSDGLGRDLVGAESIDMLEFHRAQMLSLEGRPLVQMAYTTVDGTPFAICVIQVDEVNYDPKSEFIQGLASSHWVDDKYGFLVIGGEDLSFAQDIARALAKRI